MGGVLVFRNALLYQVYYNVGAGAYPKKVKAAGFGKIAFAVVILSMYGLGLVRLGLGVLGVLDGVYGIYFIHVVKKLENLPDYALATGENTRDSVQGLSVSRE